MILQPRISGDINYKRRWEYFAAIFGILLGYPLLLVTFLIPGYSSSIFYFGLESFVPNLLTPINPMLSPLPSILRSFMISISDISVSNPYFPISFFFISFIEFPACFAWFIPGVLLGFYRNKQFLNIDVKNTGWKVFWHGTIFLELTIIIMSFGFILTFLLQLIPGLVANEAILSYFGGGILKILFFGFSPFFWLGLFSAGLGGYVGKRVALNKTKMSEVVIEEVEPEGVFEEEEFLAEAEFGKIKGEDKILWPEIAGVEAVDGDTFGIPEINIASLKAKIKSSAEGTATQMVVCSKCNKKLPSGAKFCNNCGNRMEG